MELNEVLLKLQQTEKGNLIYGQDKLSQTELCKFRERPFVVQRPVFDVSSLKAALESCEESAFTEEAFVKENDSPVKNEFPDKDKNKIHNYNGICEISSFVVGKNPAEVISHLEVEAQRDKEKTMKEKTRAYEISVLAAQKTAAIRCQEAQKKLHERYIKGQEKIRKFIHKSEEDANRIKQQNAELHKSRDRILKTRLQEAENRRLLKLEQGKKRLETAEPIVIKCSEIHKRLMLQFENESYKKYESNPAVVLLLKNICNTHLSLLATIETCRDRGIMDQVQLDEISQGYDEILTHSKQLITVIEKVKLEEQRLEVEKQRKKKLQEEKEEVEKRRLKEEQEKRLSKQNPELSAPPVPKELMFSVSRAAYHNHQQYKTLFDEFEKTSKEFTSNKANMKLIMGINKAISVPISSITNRSGSDIKNKLADLNGVLQGQSIKVVNQHVRISDDKLAISYANLFMAKKLVKQAEGQVSSNHSTAFSLALTVLGVWAKNKTFGQLFLVQMQIKCPFLIPWYVPKLENQSENEYNRLRGYQCSDDGTVEVQDKYLSRMSGLVRSYAAIIQSPLPPGVQSHPHGIAEGWKWLSRMLDLDPWPEVTATVLYDFLDVAGYALMKAYGRQFEKLLYALCHDYFPKIEEISGSGGGPLQRLQMFLKDCVKKKRVPKPDGYLGEDFWNTHHHSGVVGS
ncbi:unnamed protein product [Clavelina lepadiformis]|uniref:mRNA export factor GLE1 n=1 Tax=Clavelina lepadiformis TaxID=159417 RepID=A0ABP0GFN7_CLALP